MSQELTCKAIVQQGPRKGLQCLMTDLENEYCWKHQRNRDYDLHIANDKIPCNMFYRGCNTILSKEDVDKGIKCCNECRIKKNPKKFNCNHSSCINHIKTAEQKYCHLHQRDLLRDDEIARGVQYCNIERGCFNILEQHKLKCNECIQKVKTSAATDIQNLRDKHNIQVETTCSILASKQEEKLIEVNELWRGLQRNAYSRELMISITREEFEKMVIKPCYYCGFTSLIRLNGVDRIDNNKGYIPSNCIPCCKMCNMIKQAQHPVEFLDKVAAIINFVKNGIPISASLIDKWKSTYLTNKRNYKYNEYKSKSINYRNITFELTEQEFNTLRSLPCYLCGIITSEQHTNGIDRYNPAIGYILPNCKSCCTHCNVIKGQYSFIDIYTKCDQIVQYNCNKDIFIELNKRDKRSELRNEFYTANAIIEFMNTNKFDNYIEWCKEKNKTAIYISEITEIYKQYISKELDISNTIIQLQHSLDKDRTSKTNITQNKKHNASTIYAMLAVDGVDSFKKWYNQNYTPSNSFEKSLTSLMAELTQVDKKTGIELCRKFMDGEKNRRNNQKIRDKLKSDINYEITTVLEQEPIVSKPIKHKVVKELPVTIQIPQHIVNATLSAPKQWKVKEIYRNILANTSTYYKEWCEKTNELSGEAWETSFAKLLTDVKSTSTFEVAEPIIRSFIEGLRHQRHNKLVAEYNNKRNPVSREDRQQWPSASILKAYKENKINAFKEWLDSQDENAEDPAGIARWDALCEQLGSDLADKEKAAVISKFLTARRARNHRAASKKASTEIK